MSFVNKVVIVTGASSGIGAATATLFAKEGAYVTIVGRNETKLKAVAQKITAYGKPPLIVIEDLANEDAPKRIVKETVNKFKKIDVLVNNAGFASCGSITDGNFVKCYDEVMRVNVRAVMDLTTLCTPHLKETKGNIVNVSSVASMSVPIIPSFLPYSISKAALDQFTKGAALELAQFGIRVNSVNPGPVVTDFLDNMQKSPASWDDLQEMTALKRNSTSEEIGEMILYLAGDKAKGITGAINVVDNGFLLLH